MPNAEPVGEHAALALYGERMVAESETARLLLALAGTLLIGVSVVVAAIVVRQALTGAVEAPPRRLGVAA